MDLNSQLLTVQILTNNVQMLILFLLFYYYCSTTRFFLSTNSKMKIESSIKPPLTALKNVFVQGSGSAGCPERNNHFLYLGVVILRELLIKPLELKAF